MSIKKEIKRIDEILKRVATITHEGSRINLESIYKLQRAEAASRIGRKAK